MFDGVVLAIKKDLYDLAASLKKVASFKKLIVYLKEHKIII